MDWLLGWLTAALSWFWGLVKDAIGALVDLLQDGVVWVLDGLLGAVADAIGALPVPEFLGGGLGTLFGSIPPEVAWFVGQLGLVQAVGVIGSGVGFRMLRKLVTLGQW